MPFFFFFLMACVTDSFKIHSYLWSYAGERQDSDWLMSLKQHISLAHNRCPYGNMIVFSHMTWVTNFGYVCGRFGSSACSQTLTKISLSHTHTHTLPFWFKWGTVSMLARSHWAKDILPSNAAITGLSPPVCQLLLSNSRTGERG